MLFLRLASDRRHGRSLLSIYNGEDVQSVKLLSCYAEGVPPSQFEQSHRTFYVRVLLSPSWDKSDVEFFGRYGIVELADREVDDSTGQQHPTAFYISGGKQSEANDSLRELLRLAHSDHRSLVSLLRDEQLLSVECLNESFAPQEQNPIQVALKAGTHLRSRLMHWSTVIPVAATPFLMPNVIGAQCANPDSGDYDSRSNYSGVDFNHIIYSDEGGNATSGYIPTSSSGVTIAGGLDLGVNDSSDLSNMGVPQDLIDQFTPFLAPGPGQTCVGSCAQQALANNPQAAQINITQANQINQAIYNYKATHAATAFNNASPNMMFTDLNVQWQTALVSLYFNYQAVPNSPVWSQAANGQWDAAIQTLQTNYPAQPSRGKAVANYLINSGCTSGTAN